MPRKQDETLGWGTIGFWFAVVGVFLAVLMFGVLIPSGTQQQTTQTETPDPAQPQQPAGPAR